MKFTVRISECSLGSPPVGFSSTDVALVAQAPQSSDVHPDRSHRANKRPAIAVHSIRLPPFYRSDAFVQLSTVNRSTKTVTTVVVSLFADADDGDDDGTLDARETARPVSSPPSLRMALARVNHHPVLWP